MIEFKCHCSQTIQTPDDQAGGLIQCPRCGRLNDIPSLSDLRNLDAEGGFKLTDLEVVDEPTRLKRATEAFTRKRVDDFGEEIDLRPTLEDVARAGIDEVPLADESADIGGTPKYDPMTGELIVPLQVKKDPPAKDTGPIPMATPVLGYAPQTADGGSAPIWLALLLPINLLTMFFVLLTYLLYAILSLFFAPFAVIFGIRSFWLGMILIGPIVMAHFVNVITEVAFEERDELPRFLRNLSWGEDVWGPFVQFALAAGICFGPLWLWVNLLGVSMPNDPGAAAMIALGAIMFPAVLVTLATSGALANLRPDRLFSVMQAAGLRYIWLSVVSVLVFFLSLCAVGGVGTIPLATVHELFNKLDPPAWIALPIVLLQLYLAHYGAWQLGLLHRAKHARFQWVNQVHIRHNRNTVRPRRPARRPAAASSVRSKA